MNAAQRDLLRRVAFAVVGALVLAPMIGPFLPAVPFHRVLVRCFVLLSVVGFTLGRGPVRAWVEPVQALGLRGPARAPRFFAGAGVSLGVLALVLWVHWVTGGRGAAPPSEKHWLANGASALLTGVLVAYFEETLFRGYLRDVVGGFASAFCYAALHNFRPLAGSAPAGADYDPLLGLETLPVLCEQWTDPARAGLTLLSLLLLGLILNLLRERTGTLYAGIGVHAGLVFGLGFYRRFLTAHATDPLIYGGVRLYDGWLAAGVLLVAYGVLKRIPPGRHSRPA